MLSSGGFAQAQQALGLVCCCPWWSWGSRLWIPQWACAEDWGSCSPHSPPSECHAGGSPGRSSSSAHCPLWEAVPSTMACLSKPSNPTCAVCDLLPPREASGPPPVPPSSRLPSISSSKVTSPASNFLVPNWLKPQSPKCPARVTFPFLFHRSLEWYPLRPERRATLSSFHLAGRATCLPRAGATMSTRPPMVSPRAGEHVTWVPAFLCPSYLSQRLVVCLGNQSRRLWWVRAFPCRAGWWGSAVAREAHPSGSGVLPEKSPAAPGISVEPNLVV